MNNNQIDTMTITRDDLDCVSIHYPRGHAKYPEGQSFTQREVIIDQIKKHGAYHGRKDIALVNVNYADGSHEQFVVDPTRSGEPNYGQAARYFTASEKAAIREMNQKLLLTEQREGWPIGTLSGY